MSEKHADFNYCCPRPGTEILYSACPCWDAVTKKKMSNGAHTNEEL